MIITTCVSESDGSACPRGWYVLCQIGAQKMAFGPHTNAIEALKCQQDFLQRSSTVELTSNRDATFKGALKPVGTQLN